MIAFWLAIRAQSEANMREHWAVKARRAKNHKQVAANLVQFMRVGIKPVLKITLTRHGKGTLDTDNLAGSMKAVRDGICSALRIDDGSPLVVFEYRQEKAKDYRVHVAIERSE